MSICVLESEQSGDAHSTKLDTSGKQGPVMLLQSEAEGLQAARRATGVSLYCGSKRAAPGVPWSGVWSYCLLPLLPSLSGPLAS